MSPIANIAAYRFVTLNNREALRTQLFAAAESHALKGTILLAPEGINIFLAGPAHGVRAFLAVLEQDARLTGIAVKWSWSEDVPFKRLRVRLKKEIITLRNSQVDPQKDSAPYLPAQTLKKWLDEKQDVVLLDTRNEFEIDAGTFEQAINPHIHAFGQFPQVVEQLAELKDKTIVTFCTGGIRCEKAAPLLKQAGFRNVWQLEGGILKYFEECGGAHWRGNCVVFDDRTALRPDLSPIAPSCNTSSKS